MTGADPAIPGSSLGRAVGTPCHYDPSVLFPIARSIGRSALALGPQLPFLGHDRWHAYELSWLDRRGKPVVETATFTVPATSPNLIESKSLKLYLNSLNGSRFDDPQALRARIATDLSHTAGAAVEVGFGLPPMDADGDGAASIDALELDIDHYGPPDATLLRTTDDEATETLVSRLLKSNCPVTAQPDWAQLRIDYRGPRIDRAGLLRYVVSFRDHADFHEHCVERIFVDLMARCRPHSLSVQARYTRRGGLDINPWRATSDCTAPTPARDLRQ